MNDILEFLLPREQYCVPFTSRLAKQGVKFYSAFFETADMFIERANGNICSAVLLSNEGFLFPVFTKQSFPDAVAALLKHSKFYKKRFLTIMGLKSDVISLEGNLSSEKVISVDYHLLTARSENVKAAAGNYLQNKSLSKIPGLKVRHASAEDIDTLMPLRKAYEIEEVVFDPGSYNESSSRKRFLNTIKTTKVLFAESRGPIATCCINAEGFSWAQIGGVYTVPGKRSLGQAHGGTFQLYCREQKGFDPVCEKRQSPRRQTLLKLRIQPERRFQDKLSGKKIINYNFIGTGEFQPTQL
jgi:hypothetical protein